MTKPTLLEQQMIRDGIIPRSRSVPDHLLLAEDWEVPEHIRQQLIGEGYEPKTLSLYRDLFVFWARSSKQLLYDPSEVYARYCRSRRRTQFCFGEALHPNWTPSVDSVLKLGNLSVETLISLLKGFTLYAQGRQSSNWDEYFVRWARRKLASRP